MSHTFSVCTPSFLGSQLCMNKNLGGDISTSLNISVGPFSYQYTPTYNQCTTITYSDRVVNYCGDVTHTVYNPQNINVELRELDNLLQNLIHNTNSITSRIEARGGVSAGDSCLSSDIVSNNIDQQITSNISISPDRGASQMIVNTTMPFQYSNDYVFCMCCGGQWDKKYLLLHKAYNCLMCDIGHVFVPFYPKQFGDIDDVKEKEILDNQRDHYNNFKGYWIN